MTPTEIIKRRLVELKRMSIQLKQSTQNNNHVDYNLVYGILQATKSSAQKMNSEKEEVDRLREMESGSKQNGYAHGRRDNRSGENKREQSPLSRLLAMNSNGYHYQNNTPNSKNSNNKHPYNPTLFPQTRFSPQRQVQNSNKKSTSDSHINNHFGNNYKNNLYESEEFIRRDDEDMQDQEGYMGTLGYENFGSQWQQQTDPSNSFQPHTQQQITSLKQQNHHLEKTILTMRHQLYQLKQKLQQSTKEQQWKQGLPYFRLNETINAFYTRMKINQSDFGRIEYVGFQVELGLEKLVVKKASGVGTMKELDLRELREVSYVDSVVMFLHFGSGDAGEEEKEKERKNSQGNGRGNNAKEHKHDEKLDKSMSNQENFQNFFIKFENQQELHRWDLALYINFKIIEALKKDKLFMAHLKRSRSKSRKRSSEAKYYNGKDLYNPIIDSGKKSKRSSDHIFQDDEDLMKKLIQRRDLYLETKKIVSQRMIEKVNEKKSLQTSGKGKKAKELYGNQDYVMDDDQYSQTHPFQINNEDDDEDVPRNKFNYVVRDEHGNEQTEGERSQRANTSKFKDLMGSGKNMSGLNNVDNIIIPTLNIGGSNASRNKDDDRTLSFNPDQHNLSLSHKLQEEKIKQASQQQKRLEQAKSKKIQETIQKFIQQGYDLTKYSKDGFNPHDKRFFLSDDLKKFCWEEEGGKNKKSIQLKDIKEVMLEKIGEGIRKHIKRPKREEHCIISYMTKDNKMKVIELGANSTVMAQFVDQLITVIDHLKTKE